MKLLSQGMVKSGRLTRDHRRCPGTSQTAGDMATNRPTRAYPETLNLIENLTKSNASDKKMLTTSVHLRPYGASPGHFPSKSDVRCHLSSLIGRPGPGVWRPLALSVSSLPYPRRQPCHTGPGRVGSARCRSGRVSAVVGWSAVCTGATGEK